MVAVNYLWNPINDNIVREFDDAGNTIAEYTTEPGLYGSVVSQYRDGQTSYLHCDGPGSTTELTNNSGTVTDTIRFSAFGELTHRTGTTEIRFQYTGQLGYYEDHEPVGYNVRHRLLVAEHGRWLSLDPLKMFAASFAYVYALNSPVNYTDPSGLKCIVCKWGGPYFTGAVDDYDKDLILTIHRLGLNKRVGFIVDEIDRQLGVKPDPLPKVDSYGPFMIDMRNKGKDVVIACGCHAIRVYVCGDDCRVTIAEKHRHHVWSPRDRMWREIGSTEKTAYENVTPALPGGELLYSELKTSMPADCNYVILLSDCPAKSSQPGKRKFEAMEVTQTVTVSGRPSLREGTATLTHKFWIGVKMPAVADFESDYRKVEDAKSTTMGKPGDCC